MTFFKKIAELVLGYRILKDEEIISNFNQELLNIQQEDAKAILQQKNNQKIVNTINNDEDVIIKFVCKNGLLNIDISWKDQTEQTCEYISAMLAYMDKNPMHNVCLNILNEISKTKPQSGYFVHKSINRYLERADKVIMKPSEVFNVKSQLGSESGTKQ